MEIYWGEKICESIVKSTNKPCENKSYYLQDNKILCGCHSIKDKRQILNKNPKMDEIIETNYLKHTTHIEDIAENNKNNNILGKVLVSKLKMMQKPELIKGYINVYPNYKHQHRTDGFGCSMLSPKSLGPIEHNMSNLPTAKNLENYHQFAKF